MLRSELAQILPVDFRIDDLALLGDFGVKCLGKMNNRLMRYDAYHQKNISPSLYNGGRPTTPSKVLGQAFLQLHMSHPCRITAVDHKLDEIGIGTVHGGDAMRSDLTIDGGETAEENVIEHTNGVSANSQAGRAYVKRRSVY
jgi:hypothetical protein